MEKDINCNIPCSQIIKMLNSCPSKPINFNNLASTDIQEIIMVALSITPYPLSFIILLSGTYYRTTRSIFILVMTFIQNFIVEVIKNNLKDPRPNYKCNQQYGNPSNHTSFFTCILVWFIMEELFTPRLYKIKNKKFLVPLYGLYPFVIYSRVYLHYHTWEQIITGFILGIFISVTWFLMSTKVILNGDNVFKNILQKLNVVNTLTKDSIGFGCYNKVFSQDETLEKKYKELMEKNEKLMKLKNDLKKLTKNIQSMEFMKNGNHELSKMMEKTMGMTENENSEDEKINNPHFNNVNQRGESNTLYEEDEIHDEEEEEEYDEEMEENEEDKINTNNNKENISHHNNHLENED